jgi:hypothetical protein
MKIQGSIQDKSVLILVGTNTFLSSKLASQLTGVQPLPKPVHVQVANGGILTCASFIQQAHWSVGESEFNTDMKILPLQHFDIILGMDWLEQYSPMKVHWQHKWLAIPYADATAFIQGVVPKLPSELAVHVCALLELPQSEASVIHPAVAHLLDEFSNTFTPPTSLPPERDCDHVIPLVPGAKPVHIRPYRYPPSLKDEIEKQVVDMLSRGIIQPSVSAFSSPILLVRKKDGTWRFCVDYRYLNAPTLKSGFPIPVFDELMDELAKATWFSTLDLNSGYHQIRLKKGEEFKIAFQTHFGHFEFKVLAFGLCGAPGTFQGAMNTTLSPLLRKCVLVFFDDILVYSETFDDHIQHLKLVLQLLSRD